MAGRLFVVGVPIGNPDELTERAKKALCDADIIACEDTRFAGLVTQQAGVKKRLVSCHKFNERSRIDALLSELLCGHDIAFISDAGTPCISDPGHLLVAAAHEAGVDVIGVSGPCAATLALSISGFAADCFAFLGFLPRERKDICTRLRDALNVGETIVFYESPRRIMSTLQLLCELDFVDSICLCNDLTKKFERIYRGSTAEILAALSDNPNREKGEYTGVLRLRHSPAQPDAISIEARLVDIMLRDNLSLRDAMERCDAPRNEIYKASLRLKEFLGKASESAR